MLLFTYDNKIFFSRELSRDKFKDVTASINIYIDSIKIVLIQLNLKSCTLALLRVKYSLKYFLKLSNNSCK